MRFLSWLILIAVPALLWAQSGFNLTGRVSLRTMNVQYDKTSLLKPDTIPDDQYAKTPLIPGLQQRLNIALFGRTKSMDITLLGDLKNNAWNQLNQFKRVDRLSLNIRTGLNELILGDFFENGSDLFIQSREVRGAKLHLENTGTYYYQLTVTGGEVQRALDVGERLNDLYHQYETSGQYRRYMAAGIVRFGKRDRFNLGLRYLWGKDDSKSIKQSILEPLTNRNIGADGFLYVWQRHVKFFFEGDLSRKDTLSAKNVRDHAYRAGIDFRYKHFKLLGYKQRLGYDYYSVGYPYLQTDRDGFVLNSAYNFTNKLALTFEGEQYHDNLNHDQTRPKTNTHVAVLGLTSMFPRFPEIALKFRYRDDHSNTILDTVKTDKTYGGVEGRISFGSVNNRLTLSTIYLNLKDNSVLQAGSALGTRQLINSLNFYTRPNGRLFLSGGAVVSLLKLTNDQTNTNAYVYTSGRWDIIPARLKAEGNLSYIYNDAAHGGYQDMLSDYAQIRSLFSLEYFFNSKISLKILAGNDYRDMRYALAQAQKVIADPDYGPTYFNGYESYNGLKYGVELNWIF